MTMNSLVHWPRAELLQSAGTVDNGELTDNDFDTSNPSLSDEVFRLREWGTHRMISLRVLAERHEQAEPASTAALEISGQNITRDIVGFEIVCESQSWRLKDWAGAANLKQDGVPTREVTLLAGTEVTIAGRILIAESPRTIGLRAFFSRLLGWSDEHIEVVDQALRAIRLASSGRAILVLRGVGDLVPFAFAIHQHVVGREAPFVVSDPRRRNMPDTARGPANCKSGITAFHKAFGGTLCVRAGWPPPDFGDVLELFRESDSSVRLLICVGRTIRDIFPMTTAPIKIPSLASRQGELARILRECADDALELSCAPKSILDQQDLEWVSKLPNLTIPEIDKAFHRIVAIKTSCNLSTAARKLGMAPVSLTRWLARRRVSKEASFYVPQPDRSRQYHPKRTSLTNRTSPQPPEQRDT